MSSIFTFQDELPRIQSPWSTPGDTTPQPQHSTNAAASGIAHADGKTRLEAEKQDGPCEYKLHLLLRARRHFVSMSTAQASTPAGPMRLPAVASLSSSGRSLSETQIHRSTYQPSPQTRQARLQQLTTQLLWRLQQSSPFHSSSNAELVPPVLPEATPRLGVPDRPEKLLPGLEESQGALYEIGVADDGTLVGLVDEELEESLNNLRAMAASLGCVVDILRKVAVGTSVWIDYSKDEQGIHREGTLYAAEVLVRPDTKSVPLIDVNNGDQSAQGPAEALTCVTSGTEQLRIALVGPSAVGKSSLLGTLTTSRLDNGRGKSRLSLLKHRHEIASGITSSVAHELLGYRSGGPATADFVVNYSSGDVSTWPDIHGLADRLCFAIDSPGLNKFAKSTYRALISWEPDWTCVCVAADDGEIGVTPQGVLDEAILELSLAHLDLCLKLGVNIIVVITKMDMATKTRLRTILGRILTCLKNAGKKPLLLATASAPVAAFALDATDTLPDLQRVTREEDAEVLKAVGTLTVADDALSVPIVMTSTVSGAGIGKMHRLLSCLPLSARTPPDRKITNMFQVDEVFGIPPVRIYNGESEFTGASSSGAVLCGRVEHGTIYVGDQLFLGPFLPNEASGERPVTRTKSLSSRDMRRLSLSAGNIESHAGKVRRGSYDYFVEVRVVSLRNLRLPVRQLASGDVGTIGIESLDQAHCLERARKGMVLSATDLSNATCHGFVASFAASDFLVASPPLILGGHATVYLNSIRAAIKVVALALVEDSQPEPSSPAEVFAFEDEQGPEQDTPDRTVSITMRFVNSVECVSTGVQVLVVPTFSAAGPVTGPTSSMSSIAGFIGRVVETMTNCP